jgi:hypothetical protein
VPAPTEGNTQIHNLTLARTVFAYEEPYYGGNRYTEEREEESVTEWHVVVRDLRTGRVLHRVPTGMKEIAHPMYVGDGPTTAIVVKSDGAVAWVLDTAQQAARYQVHALDKSGERVLASGSDVDPHSLALAGSTLYWKQGGKPFSTVLN